MSKKKDPMNSAIQIVQTNGKKVVTMKEDLAVLYILNDPDCLIAHITLDSDNIKAVIAGAEGTWLDLMTREDTEAFIDLITEQFPSEAEKYRRAESGH